MKKKICVIAPGGAVGKVIIKELQNYDDLIVSSGIVRDTSEMLGYDLGIIAGIGKELNIKATSDLDTSIKECDAIIDFSSIEFSMKVLEIALKYSKPLACGVTGYNEDQKEQFNNASLSIPLMYSDNTSRLFNIMQEAVAYITTKIDDDIDIDIIEMHKNKKPDKPSGTSKDLTKIIQSNETSKHKIETHSIRSGDIASTHEVFFGAYGERIEMIHRAYDNTTYAKGAIDAAIYLLKQKPGRYTAKEIFNL